MLLSRVDVHRVIAQATNLKHRTMLLTAYAGGLRLTEVLRPQVTDVDSSRMTIRVQQGKGGRDRYTVLSASLLDALRRYCKVYHPTTWLFPSRVGNQPMDPSGLQRAYQTAKRRAGIKKPGGFTRCGMRSPRICWKRASTSTRSSGYSAIGPSARRPGTGI